MHSYISIILVTLFIPHCTPLPLTHIHSDNLFPNGIDLRILPLGDSITWGEGSTDGNGYRLALSNLITNDSTNKLQYIGSVKSGSMINNENEGHGGFTIDAIGETGRQDYALKPNVVLFMAGTNDVVFDVDLANASNRLGGVIAEVIAGCPDATVLVGSLLPLVNPGWMSGIKALNIAIPGVVSEFAGKRKHVALVDMGRVKTSHIQSDGIHPTDEAYGLLAAAWYDGIKDAGKKGWIKEPFPETKPEPSQSTADDTEAVHSMDGSGKGNLVNTWAPTYNGWDPARVAMYAIVIFGLLLVARKAAILFIHRYRG